MDVIQLSTRPRRCAIYTRRSAECPRIQEITSLESQRSICSSYIASQQHKGWVEIAKHYDDEKTGAHLRRPALQELLADVETGQVDVVLVYKLDRITRTLLDFVRLIDMFDRFGVVFVAITQNFDTSDSMGRLIRNLLLTFAQFEREIAGDRIRDKRRVLCERGRWSGGNAPTGYELRNRKLVVHKQEAKLVRCVFETFAKEKSPGAAHKELIRRGMRLKRWKTKNGKIKGGGWLALTSVRAILSNPVYIGEIKCHEDRFKGVHEPIIDRALWDQVQAILADRSHFRPQPENLLTGFVYDGHGRRMHGHPPEHRDRSPQRYYRSVDHYWAKRHKIRRMYARADALERITLEAVGNLLADRLQLRLLLARIGVHGAELDTLVAVGGSHYARLANAEPRKSSQILRALLERVEVHHDYVRLVLRLEALESFLAWDWVGLFCLNELQRARPSHLQVVDVPVRLDTTRDGHGLPVERRDLPCRPPDQRLVKILEEARETQRMLFENRDMSPSTLGYCLGKKPVELGRLVRLNYLAPDIVAAILDGTQPESLTPGQLRKTDIPIDWPLQRRLLGFPARLESDFPAIGSSSREQIQASNFTHCGP